MKRWEIALLIGLLAAILISSFTAFAGDCEEIRGEVVRIHVLANSDSEEDQALKLKVRDAVLVGTKQMFTSSGSKEQVEALALANLDNIQALAQAEIDAQGYDYAAKAVMVNMFFDTRVYGDVTLPAGYYDAVRITIGEGAGKNWWCVMFPPMCIPAASPDDGGDLEQQIAGLGQAPQYKAKFAVVELIETIKEQLGTQEETDLTAEQLAE